MAPIVPPVPVDFNDLRIYQPKEKVLEKETSFEPVGNKGSNYVPSYQRSLGSLPGPGKGSDKYQKSRLEQLSYSRNDDEKERREEDERRREEERRVKEEERKLEEEIRLAEERRAREIREEEERRVKEEERRVRERLEEEERLEHEKSVESGKSVERGKGEE